MDLPSIEILAQSACFATDYSAKTHSEQAFFNLCLQIGPEQLEHLMTNGSQTLLFVLMEFLHKVLSRIKEHHQSVFLVLCATVEQWYTKNATLIRLDKNPLEKYVENSVGRTLGQTLKYLYSDPDHRNWVRDQIEARPSANYRLYLWKVFIETISNIDGSFTFLTYRATVYSFQENIIPIIMDALLPYFQSVEDLIKVNELAAMQEKLAVSEHQPSGERVQLFQPGELKFTTLVFNLLKEVICFNYNITYSEFESESPIENCLVCFPDQVTKKVISREFIDSMFFVIEKLIVDDSTSPFLAITLECIQKIMLTKLFYTSTEAKKNFIQSMLQGMIRLLRLNSLTEESTLSLIESNSKFLINIELYQVRQFDQQFHIWISLLKGLFLRIIQQTPLSFDNSLLNESLDLANKIVEEAVAPQLKEEMQKFKDYGSDIIAAFLTNFLERSECSCLIGDGNKQKSYEDLKKTSFSFFKRVRNLCSVDLNGTLVYLEATMVKVLLGNDVNSISNIYFLLSELCDNSFFERNILYEAQPEVCFPKFGRILYLALEWVQKYRSYNRPIEIIETAILFFVEKLVNECLNNFSYDKDALKINSKIFKFLQMARPDITQEGFLTFGFGEIANNLVNGDLARVTYTFEVLSTLLLKFKWGSKRQNFKQTTIAHNVLSLCQRLSANNFSGEMLKLRKNLFKIIASISFDDILDDYRKNINELVGNLKKSLVEDRWKTLYDLAGICEAIDTATIYRYFLTTLGKNLPVNYIMNEFFNNAQGNMEILKAIMELQLSFIENKGQRLSGVKNSYHNYHLIGELMPCWAAVIEQADNDEWDEILLQLYRIFRTLLRGNHVNFFLLERTVPAYGKYMTGMLNNMVVVSGWIELYPELFEEYRMILKLTAEYLLEVIFCSVDPGIVRLFNQLLGIIMRLALKQIELMKEGSKKPEEVLDTCLDICRNVFRYLRMARNLTHKEKQLQNISIMGEDIELKYEFMLGLFKFGIAFGKQQPRYLDTITTILHNMDFLAGAAIFPIVQKLGLDESRKQELIDIWKMSESPELQDEFENEEFMGQIKDWFKKCDLETLPELDY